RARLLRRPQRHGRLRQRRTEWRGVSGAGSAQALIATTVLKKKSREGIVMAKLLLVSCLSFAASLLAACPAEACINDRGTKQTEHEFKKNYEFKSNYQEKDTTPDISSPSEKQWGPLAATWSGVGLLVAAASIVIVNFRRANQEV